MSTVSTVYIFVNNPYNLLALVEQIFTQQHIFSLSFFFNIEAYVVIIVARITIVKTTCRVTEEHNQHAVDKQTRG